MLEVVHNLSCTLITMDLTTSCKGLSVAIEKEEEEAPRPPKGKHRFYRGGLSEAKREDGLPGKDKETF